MAIVLNDAAMEELRRYVSSYTSAQPTRFTGSGTLMLGSDTIGTASEVTIEAPRQMWYRLDPETHETVPLPEGEYPAEDPGSRRILLNEVGNKYTVSTVFLGLDHSYAYTSRGPILFETMVFEGDSSAGLDEYTQRYRTYDEAVLGHQSILNSVRIDYDAQEKQLRKQQEQLAEEIVRSMRVKIGKRMVRIRDRRV